MNNDLISRNALIQHAYSAVVDGIETDIIHLSDVDNAPTVPQINILCENADEKAIADMKEELQKVIDDLRPQGEWVKDEEHSITIEMFKCTICGFWNGAEHFSFCPNCGAKMKGGAE